MIGQDTLVNELNSLVESNNFPRFTIICGSKGSGKKLLANNIASKLGKYVMHIDSRVFSIREMVSTAYQVKDTTVFIVEDADDMSTIAKNTLLKICEEPPNNAYIIMTIVDDNNTLDTIKSRASLYRMDIYSIDELISFYDNCSEIVNKKASIKPYIKKYCATPGDVLTICSLDLVEFDKYVDLVIDNINTTSLANSFKIGLKIAYNEEPDKYPLDLFFQAFSLKCLDRFKENPFKFGYGVKITSKYLKEMSNPSLSKQNIFDMWLLAIRNMWDNAESSSQH